MKVIDYFRGEYEFLSNFYLCDVEYDGLVYKSSEAAFQSAKTLDKVKRLDFLLMSPSKSKKEGKYLDLREDWEEVKAEIMLDVIWNKFMGNIDLARKLLATGDAELVEGNTWGDTYWGVCKGRGKNVLGEILMIVREDIREKHANEILNVSCTVVNLKEDYYDVYIGRGSKWGNPYVKTNMTKEERDDVCDAYEEYFYKNGLDKDLAELKGMILGCYCKPLRCHGDFIARLVNEKFPNNSGA